MVADVGFKKQLWALDPELDVVWDWGSSKWEIWKFPGQGNKKIKRVDHLSFHLMTVQTGKRSFRELGADILLKLQQGDTHRYSLKQLVSYFDQMDDNINRAKEKAFRDKIEAISFDTFDYARGVLKVSVPRTLPAIKPSEERYLLNVPQTSPGANYHIFQKPVSKKLESAIGGI